MRYDKGMVNIIMAALMSLALLPYRSTGGIFHNYDMQAEQKLAEMSVDEKIAQVLLVRYPDTGGISALAEHQFGGYVFFAKDFAGKSAAEVQDLMKNLQAVAKIPILTAVDEEGGTVVRVSSNPQLAPVRFRSPQAVYAAGGLSAVAADTKQKSVILEKIGLNLNLAPVVDVSTDPKDYMFSRSLGQNAQVTAEFARTVIEASRGSEVSYTLKHFPGYGNNLDTHTSSSIDQRNFDDLIQRDLVPFQAGIDSGAEAVLVSHNTVTALDPENPASLSSNIHTLLRLGLGFTGVIITDDIAMAALDASAETTLQAILAGNDLVITSDYARSMRELRLALADGRLEMVQLDRAVKRVLAWKYYKSLIL